MELIESIRRTLDEIEEAYHDELNEEQGTHFDEDNQSYFSHGQPSALCRNLCEIDNFLKNHQDFNDDLYFMGKDSFVGQLHTLVRDFIINETDCSKKSY